MKNIDLITDEDLPQGVSSKSAATMLFSHTNKGQLIEVSLVIEEEDSTAVKMQRAKMRMKGGKIGSVQGWACHVTQLYLSITGEEDLELDKNVIVSEVEDQ